MSLQIEAFHHADSFTFTYLVYHTKTHEALVIDPVLDFDYFSATISTDSLKQLVKRIQELGLKLDFILETHIHADHLSSAAELKEVFPNAKLGINSRIDKVREHFTPVFAIEKSETKNEFFDLLLSHGQKLPFAKTDIEVLHTPGHTPACTCFKIGSHLFTGDALFMPDSGTGRCDFPGGDAKLMYQSVKELVYSLPDDTQTYTGHDYRPGGRELKYQASIKQHKLENIHLKEQTTLEEYVNFRTERDSGLKVPKLLYPSIQFNMSPKPLKTYSKNQRLFLTIPVQINH
jgi:glyoxylase-like metal-dependent hydrolase (beta-lactamase superfamily II)